VEDLSRLAAPIRYYIKQSSIPSIGRAKESFRQPGIVAFPSFATPASIWFYRAGEYLLAGHARRVYIAYLDGSRPTHLMLPDKEAYRFVVPHFEIVM
jgi:hypothetical protein